MNQPLIGLTLDSDEGTGLTKTVRYQLKSNYADAIAAIDQPEFRRRYFGLKKKFLWIPWINWSEYDGPIGEEDFEYSWSNFEEMRVFFSKAAAAHRASCNPAATGSLPPGPAR